MNILLIFTIPIFNLLFTILLLWMYVTIKIVNRETIIYVVFVVLNHNFMRLKYLEFW